VDAVRGVSVPGRVESDDRIEYDFDGFSLLLSTRDARPTRKELP
jgi:hypothetical protein